MLTQTEQDQVKRIVGWLREKAEQEHLPVDFPAGNKARLDAGLLVSIPAVVNSNGSAGEKADALQRLEDAWNRQKPDHLPEVLLVPAVA